MKTLPARLYICPACGYKTPYRWVLARHLREVHSLRKNDSMAIAQANEYFANPMYRTPKNCLSEENYIGKNTYTDT